MVWISKSELAEVLGPLADLCTEIERSGYSFPDSGAMLSYPGTTVTLGQLRAVKRLHDEASR